MQSSLCRRAFCDYTSSYQCSVAEQDLCKDAKGKIITYATNPFLAATRTPCIPRLKPKWPRLKFLTIWVMYRAKHISEWVVTQKRVRAWELLGTGNDYGVLEINHRWNNSRKVDVPNTTLCLWKVGSSDLPTRWIALFCTKSSK